MFKFGEEAGVRDCDMNVNYFMQFVIGINYALCRDQRSRQGWANFDTAILGADDVSG